MISDELRIDGDPVTKAGSLLDQSPQALRGEIQRLMTKTPALSSNGIGKSPHHSPDAHERARRVLSSSDGEAQVRRALLWIAHSGVRPSSVARQRCSSYDAKHQVEGWFRRRSSENAYVSNGAFIAACLLTGVEVIGIEGSPNVWVGLARSEKASSETSPWAA